MHAKFFSLKHIIRLSKEKCVDWEVQMHFFQYQFQNRILNFVAHFDFL